MRTKLYLFTKNVFDFCAALVATVFFLIPWLVIAIIIKIQSPGPIVYKARRVGKDGKVFMLYKFRSMRVDSGKVRMTTLRNDERIFPFGRFLRDSKLDETLQLINILKLQMSVIGPRPEDEYNAGQIYTDRYKKILSVKPGLSSPASLYDYTHGETYENEKDYLEKFLPQKLELELYYIENRSVIYDVKTIFKTVYIVLLRMFGKEQFDLPREYAQIEPRIQQIVDKEQ